MLKFDFQTVPRSALYYQQWQYVIAVHLLGASFLRVLNHKTIETSINYRNSWVSRRGPLGDNIGEEIRNQLHVACDYLLNRKKPFKKVVCGNCMWFYTNDPTDFEDLDTFDNLTLLHTHQVELSLTPDVVLLKKPKHAFRTYFRERWLEKDQLAALQRYFSTRTTQFKMSPGFKKLVSGKRMWLMSNYFVDHDEPQADFLINLAVPGVVRKTFPIVERGK